MRAPSALAALAVLVASALIFSGPAAAGGPGKQGVTAIAVQGTGPARYVVGDDGRRHIEYDLVITNGFPVEVTLKSLTVRAEGQRRLTLTGEAVAAHTHAMAS